MMQFLLNGITVSASKKNMRRKYVPFSIEDDSPLKEGNNDDVQLKNAEAGIQPSNVNLQGMQSNNDANLKIKSSNAKTKQISPGGQTLNTQMAPIRKSAAIPISGSKAVSDKNNIAPGNSQFKSGTTKGVQSAVRPKTKENQQAKNHTDINAKNTASFERISAENPESSSQVNFNSLLIEASKYPQSKISDSFEQISDTLNRNIQKTGPKLWEFSTEKYELMPNVITVYFIFFANFFKFINRIHEKYGEQSVIITQKQWDIINSTKLAFISLINRLSTAKTAPLIELVMFFNRIKNCVIVFDEIVSNNVYLKIGNNEDFSYVCNYCNESLDSWVKCRCGYMIHTHCIWMIITKTNRDQCPICSRIFFIRS